MTKSFVVSLVVFWLLFLASLIWFLVSKEALAGLSLVAVILVFFIYKVAEDES